MKIKTYHKKGSRLGRKRAFKVFGLLLVVGGLLTLAYFFLPIVSYHFFISSAFANNETALEVPVPKYDVVKNEAKLANLIQTGIKSLNTDFTDARNWYPGVDSTVDEKHEVQTYMISIPEINIKNAVVSTIDYNLSAHLVQYFGTTTPPQNGTTIIYGHSTLPQMFDQKNYKTIFANLHKIETGDEIVANVDGLTYTYKVFEKIITDPEDVEIFSQSYDDSYITLVTCTPPGTIWKRLIVRAQLEQKG